MHSSYAETRPSGVQRVVTVVAPHGSDTTRLMEVARCAAADTVCVQYVGDTPVQRAQMSAVVMSYDPVMDSVHDLTQRVNRATEQGLDAIVVYDRHPRPWRRLLVPYTYGVHDPAAFALGRRLARRMQGELMLLHVDDPEPDAVPATVRRVDGCVVRIVRGGDPVALGECEAASGHDVIIVGGGTPHPQHYFAPRVHGLISRTRASLVIVHAVAEHEAFDPQWFRSDPQRIPTSEAVRRLR
jgi:hypothetical protein